jgi:hypothetical protein
MLIVAALAALLLPPLLGGGAAPPTTIEVAPAVRAPAPLPAATPTPATARPSAGAVARLELPVVPGPTPRWGEARSTSSAAASTPIASPTLAPTARSAPSTIPPPTAPPHIVTNTSGELMPRGDLPGWKMIFADDFAIDVPLGSFPSALSSSWTAYPSPWPDTSEKGMHAPQRTISISNSMMDIWLHTEAGVPLVAAPMPLFAAADGSLTADQLYGRYAVRFRADPIAGYKAAWLLWPASNVWPRDGEIDFPEGDLDDSISAFMHRMSGTSGSDQDAYRSAATYESWHTAVIEWTPASVTFLLDGTVLGQSTSRVPSTPMFWVLQTETSLDSVMPDPAAESHVQIDWVAIWSYRP